MELMAPRKKTVGIWSSQLRFLFRVRRERFGVKVLGFGFQVGGSESRMDFGGFGGLGFRLLDWNVGFRGLSYVVVTTKSLVWRGYAQGPRF